MITSISLQNFQSHKDSILEFSDGVNVILGASDSGKTTILRALRWVAFHKPSGDEMRSHWGGKTQVEIVTDDAIVVKSKDKEQEYILGDTHFKAFGTEVPQEIKDALNLDSINVQSQLDAPFLLSETPGFVASHFNKIAHLGVIDTATSNINSEISSLNSTIGKEATKDRPASGLIKQIADAESDILKFSYLEKFQSEVEVLEEQEKQLIKLKTSKDKLETIINAYQVNGETILEYKELLELEKPVNEILELIELRAKKDIEVVKLDRLIVQIIEIQSNIEKQNALLVIETPVNDLLKLYKEKEMVVNEQKQLFKAITNLNSIDRQLKGSKLNYESLHSRFEKNLGSVCILCGQKIKNLEN
jgi:exonuclease SbcC